MKAERWWQWDWKDRLGEKKKTKTNKMIRKRWGKQRGWQEKR